MKTPSIFLVIVLMLSLTSCFTSRNNKSSFQIKKEERYCKADSLKAVHNAVDPKLLKSEYFAINRTGDTVRVDFKKNKQVQNHNFNIVGYDTLMPLVSYKGKPFTGKALFVNYYQDDPKYLMSGCYITIKTVYRGLPEFTDTYFPNGKLKSRVKGFNMGIFSKYKAEYDYAGNLLYYDCQQVGVYFGYKIAQTRSKYKSKIATGSVLLAIDSSQEFTANYVVEREIGFDGVHFDDDNKPRVGSSLLERIVIQNTFLGNGAFYRADLQCKFYDYLNEQPRYFEYLVNEYNPDTVLRLHIEYLDYGGIKTLGQYFMNQKHGIWNYYHDDGSLKDVELYESGRKQYILNDENAYIYFRALYDKESGEVKQYKNDWVPHVNRDSMFFYNFNRYTYYRHMNNKGGFLSFWSLSYYVNQHSNHLDKLIESFYRKDFYSDGRAKAIGFVTDKEERTGIWIDFSHDGDTVVICDYYYGKPNGIYRKYINEVLVEKRDEIPEWRNNDPYFYNSVNRRFDPPLKRRNYWFRHWQNK
jgi:hypothetical protein